MVFVVNFAVSLQSPFYLWPGRGCMNTGSKSGSQQNPRRLSSVARCSRLGDIGERRRVPNAAALRGCKGCCVGACPGWFDGAVRAWCFQLEVPGRPVVPSSEGSTSGLNDLMTNTFNCVVLGGFFFFKPSL